MMINFLTITVDREALNKGDNTEIDEIYDNSKQALSPDDAAISELLAEIIHISNKIE